MIEEVLGYFLRLPVGMLEGGWQQEFLAWFLNL